jgi:O-antigen/teichoic acid export membrane protein
MSPYSSRPPMQSVPEVIAARAPAVGSRPHGYLRLARQWIVRSRSLSRDAAYLAVEKMVTLVVGFFVSIAIVRYLGPERYGVFSYMSAWIAVVAPLATLGLTGPLLKSFVQDPARHERVIATVLVLRVVAAVVAGAVAVSVFVWGRLLSAEHGSAYLNAVMIILALQYVAQVLDVYETYNQATGRIAQSTQARIAALLIVSALRLWAVYAQADLAAFAWLVLLQIVIGMALTYESSGTRALRWPHRLDFATAKQLCAMGSFIVLAGLLNMAQARCEMLLLERYSGMGAVGVYSAALRFIEHFDALGMIAVTVYLPRLLAREGAPTTGEESLVRTYRAALLLFAAILPLIGGMAILAYWTLAGKFEGIHWLVLAMAFRPLFTFIGLTRSMHMLAGNRLRYGALCSLVGLIVSATTALLLVPRYGVYGAAASAFLGYLCSNLLIDAALNRSYFRAFTRAVALR